MIAEVSVLLQNHGGEMKIQRYDIRGLEVDGTVGLSFHEHSGIDVFRSHKEPVCLDEDVTKLEAENERIKKK
jgi:hypothetical protein